MTDQQKSLEREGGGEKPRRPKQYMRANEREQFILQEAVRFFAEHGFEGQTRELAKRIGITHSAIYRHFPSKEALIERVYEHVYLSRWDDSWADLIVDRGRSLESRLTEFYLRYVERVFHYDWVRIFVFSGLKTFDITTRYLDIVRRQIVEPACLELRHELGLPGLDEAPLSERETELFWGLHGRIFYLAIRRFVYATPTPESLDDIVRDGVRSFMLGGPAIAKAIVRPKP
ncbi:AcrR family transcriptional regulator [Neorhizobium galegae]|nr:AcrR family transcriptional regulator [Neorhizobium galegae]MDQ0134236.1 AcrR family transcriptional regulator [Neorhizobium galegae]